MNRYFPALFIALMLAGMMMGAELAIHTAPDPPPRPVHQHDPCDIPWWFMPPIDPIGHEPIRPPEHYFHGICTWPGTKPNERETTL